MLKFAIVGSFALPFLGISTSGVKDVDIICSSADFRTWALDHPNKIAEMKPTQAGMAVVATKGWIYDFEFTDRENPTSQLLLDHILSISPPVMGHVGQYEAHLADLDTLYMLKMSHRFKRNSPHFRKTMDDIWMMREQGAKIPNKELYRKRQTATYNYAHPSLNQSKEQFFTDEVPYRYDHDSIHESMKHLDRPAYTYYAADGEEVLSSREKWDELPLYIKLIGVLEEAYVLALERSVIPFGVDAQKAYDMALEKVCTSITSGWFREFAWESFHKVNLLFEPTYVDRFNQAVKDGIVKDFNAST